MKTDYKIEPLAGGFAHYSNQSGKIQMVAFEKPKKLKREAYRMEEQIDGNFCIWPNTPQGFEDALFYRNCVACFPSSKLAEAKQRLNTLNKQTP